MIHAPGWLTAEQVVGLGKLADLVTTGKFQHGNGFIQVTKTNESSAGTEKFASVEVLGFMIWDGRAAMRINVKERAMTRFKFKLHG